MRRKHTYIPVHTDEVRAKPHPARFNRISKLFLDTADTGEKGRHERPKLVEGQI